MSIVSINHAKSLKLSQVLINAHFKSLNYSGFNRILQMFYEMIHLHK